MRLSSKWRTNHDGGSSLMLCNENKFVFIRTTRTGCNSIVQALRPHVTLHQEVPDLSHPTMAHFMWWRPDDYDKYTSFGFVRNPYSWYVSFWSITSQDTHTFEQFMMGRPNIAALHNASPMSWLTYWNSDTIAVDHVFKFEEYDESMDRVREITQVDFTLGEKSYGRYSGHYTDHHNPITRMIVESRCRACIERFEYKYGED